MTHASSQHLCVNLHLIASLRLRQVRDTDKVPNILLPDRDLLVQHRRGTRWEHIALELLRPLVWLDVVPLENCLLRRDDCHIHVATRTQIVPDTSLDSIRAELHSLVLGQLGLPLRLKDGHGGEGAGTHGHVGQLVGGAVGVDGEEVGASGVDAGDDEVGADVPLVAEEVLLEHGHDGYHAGLAAGGEGMELELGGDEGGGELGVGGGTGTGAPDVGGDVMELFAVLVGDNGA